MQNKRGSLTTKYVLILVLVMVLAVGAVKIAKYLKETTEIEMNADRYSLMSGQYAGDRKVADVKDADQVDMINKALSGKYREGKRLVINDATPDCECIVSPVYSTDDYKAVDDYANTVYHEEADDGHVIYGESIYIIDEKTIGFWDAEENNVRVLKKADGKIDTSRLMKLMNQ